MIIRSLQVEGVRCFTEPVRIKFPGEGFTVLSGPNGSGKSTLVEAMRRCLLDNHNAVGAADLQHWSEARPPRIVIEFGHAGGRYRLTKQFVSKKQAVLERKDGGSWRVVEEGRAADDKVRQMLRASGRGETGILGVLWSPQGQLPLEGVSGGVVEEIRASLGAQMAGAAGLAFEKQLRKIYEAAWQPSRKQPKKGLLQDIEQKLSEERENAESAKSTLEQADQRGQAAERLRQQAAELRVQLTAFEANFESVRKQSQEREQLSGRVWEW
jgi:predicted ATP-dependent endonuclease of OLD family